MRSPLFCGEYLLAAPRFMRGTHFFAAHHFYTDRRRRGGANRIAGMICSCHDVAMSIIQDLMKRFLIPLIAFVLAGSAHAQFTPQAQAKREARALGYTRVADAREAVPKLPGAKVTHPDGWTVVTVPKPEIAVWSFVPQGHEAYPAVVRRLVRKSDKGTFLEMKVLCEAKQDACRKLTVQFQQMTAQMQQAMQAKGR
jgi:hypothetical protein